MHNGQIGINSGTVKEDPIVGGITAGVGNLSPEKNPDQEQSVTYDMLNKDFYVKEPDNIPEEDPPREKLAQIQPTNDISPRQLPNQLVFDSPKNTKLSAITISGGSIDLKDALLVQNIAKDMLEKGDAAGFVNSIRDEDYGAVAATLKNSFGDKSVLEQSK